MISKICNKCNIEQPLANFNLRGDKKDGKKRKNPHFNYCKACKAAYNKSRNWADAPIKKSYRLMKEYGITLEQYNQMFQEQKGCCAICGIHQQELGRTLAVDHSHTSSTVRGLLCDKCNLGLGLFRDNPSLLLSAVSYLLPKI